jgi:hypothetical protein
MVDLAEEISEVELDHKPVALDARYEVPQKRWTSEIAGRWSPGRMFLCHDLGERIPLSTGSRPRIG